MEPTTAGWLDVGLHQINHAFRGTIDGKQRPIKKRETLNFPLMYEGMMAISFQTVRECKTKVESTYMDRFSSWLKLAKCQGTRTCGCYDYSQAI